MSIRAQQTEVNADSLMKHIRFLSSQTLTGRLPGTKGYELAVDYCMNYMQTLGVKPAGIGFWPQVFPIDVNQIDSAAVLIETGRDMKELIPAIDFSVRGYSGSGNVTSDVVFCGYGFDSSIYSDFAGLDIAGKIALVFKSNPPFIPDLKQFSIRRTADFAYQHGAAAIVFVSTPNQPNPQKPIGSVMHGEGPMHTDFPQIQISQEIAAELLKNSGHTLSELQTLIDSTGAPQSFSLDRQMSLMVNARYNESGVAQNVVGMIEGNDPVLKNEYIVLTAHLDHVGSLGSSVYYPGANDNASGSAAVLEMARLFSLRQKDMKRSVLFVLFACEEKGLVGAEWFAGHLPVEKEQIVAVFNMDCIAFGDSLMVGNGKSCPALWQKASEIASDHHLPMTQRTWAGGGADLTPLHQKGIPGLYFVTTNSYDHLHLPSDKPETLNQKLYAEMVQLVYFLSRHYVIDTP